MFALDVRRIGGASALLYTVLVVGFTAILLGTEIVEADGAGEFLPILTEHKSLAVMAAALLVVMPVLLALAGMALFPLLRHAGSLTWIALFGFVFGAAVIVYRGFVWMALALDLAPAYEQATTADKAVLATTGDTLETFAAGADIVGGVLIGGIGVLIYSMAMLRTGTGARWIPRTGIFAAIVGGLLTPLAPVSDVIEGINFVGFIGFIVWMAAVGVLVWRTAPVDAHTAPAATAAA